MQPELMDFAEQTYVDSLLSVGFQMVPSTHEPK